MDLHFSLHALATIVLPLMKQFEQTNAPYAAAIRAERNKIS